MSAKNTWSTYPFKPICQSQFENSVKEAVDNVAEDNPYMSVKEGEIAAIDAIRHKPGSYGLDIRPKVFDNISKQWTLLDSGSCVSCIPKTDSDKIDPNFRLRSVNGSTISTFGSETISIRINRKTYDIKAVKVDIPQRILGWDFFKKHRLGFEWGQYGDLFLTDQKANIRSLLKCFKIQSKEVESVEFEDKYEEPVFPAKSNQSVLFETKCMQDLDLPEVGALTIQPDQPSPQCDDIPLSSKADPDADLTEKENLQALTKLENEYKSLVQKYPEILKTTFKKQAAEGIYHRIETEGPSFKSKMRPLLAGSEKSEMGRQIWKEMEQMGVVERVKPNTLLQYTSPLHLVKKPNGRGWRICADFRKLNQITKNDNYPLPLLRSFQSNIKGSKIFSKLDIKSAFHHLPIHPDDVTKTCVLSPWGGAFVFKRLAFGMTNGPASWQKYLDGVLHDIPGTFCYLDDILVCSANVEEHLSTLDSIFKRFSDNNITLALDKCAFGQPTVDFLGYHVTPTGIRPMKKKVAAIERIPTPQSQKSLLQYLGALNYFRASLSGLIKNGTYHNAANLLQPLYSAATVKIPTAAKFIEVWNSSPVLQEAFSDSKKLLIQAAELSHPDPQLPLALMCDASEHSIGSVLLQQAKTGKWYPLGYMSRHLSLDKVKWSTGRKELLAAQSGLRYFISEIYGRHCTIYSDHAPFVLAFKNPQGYQLHDPVAQRALMEIGQFTKDVRHIAGLKNNGSDFLSRIPPELTGSAYQDTLASITKIAAVEGQKLHCMSPKVLQEAQETCQEIIILKAGRHPTSVTFQTVKFDDCELFCEVSLAQPRPFLPKSLRSFVMKQMHFAHDGVKETIRKISAEYYWTEMKAEITRFVRSCHGCQSTTTSKIPKPHTGFFEVPDQRFSHCHIDIVGPLPISEGYKYLLTIIDRTTRHLTALPLAEPSAKTCSQAFLLHYVALYGIPSACTSDRGSNFVSSLFTEMQKSLGIDIKHTPIYWPQGNGLVERSHQTLKKKIKASLEEMGQTYQDKWFHVLPWALLSQRTAFNKELGTSSSELTLATHIKVPGCLLPTPTSNEPDFNEMLKSLQIKNSRSAVQTSVNTQNPTQMPTNVTHVYVKQHDTRGLQPSYRGPFLVLSRPSRSTLQIKTGLTRSGEIRSELRSWSDCKPAYRRDETLEASKPTRGRPPKQPPEPPLPAQVEQNKTNIDDDPPFHGFGQPIASLDFSKPPPGYDAGNSNKWNSKPWSASVSEIENLNKMINQCNPQL